jgi:hypothetical protein
MPQGNDLSAHNPGHRQPRHCSQPRKKPGELQHSRGICRKAVRSRLEFSQNRVESGDEDDDENHRGHRIKDINKTHHHAIPPAPAITRYGAPQDADDQAYGRAHQADEQRHARAITNTA